MLPERLTRLAHLLARLPGVGEKTAQRFALHLVAGGEAFPRDLAAALVDASEGIRPCERCGMVADRDAATGRAICGICTDSRRDAHLLCIVARVQDVVAVERSGAMRGRYFVLGRLLSPLEGVGPDDLPLGSLRARIAADGITEILLATPPSVDGEATALLVARELASTGVRVSRIASGVPHGGELDLTDQITLGRAIEGRKSYGG